jgi:soluble lytic murein transglycosylase-like protein
MNKYKAIAGIIILGGSLLIPFNTSLAIGASPTQQDSLVKLLKALAIVESGNNPLAYNKKENAAGLYQIRPIYLKDVNRFSKEQFNLADRFDPVKSARIVTLYLQHYCPGGSLEMMARVHNGGPAGHKKAGTLKYWLKVKVYLK